MMLIKQLDNAEGKSPCMLPSVNISFSELGIYVGSCF